MNGQAPGKQDTEQLVRRARRSEVPQDVGRLPLTVTEAGLDQVEALAADGLSEQQIAASLGICRRSLGSIKQRQEDVLLRLDRGRGALIRELVGEARRILTHGEDKDKVRLITGMLRIYGPRWDGGEGEAPRVQVTLNLPGPMSPEDYMRTVGAGSSGKFAGTDPQSVPEPAP